MEEMAKENLTFHWTTISPKVSIKIYLGFICYEINNINNIWFSITKISMESLDQAVRKPKKVSKQQQNQTNWPPLAGRHKGQQKQDMWGKYTWTEEKVLRKWGPFSKWLCIWVTVKKITLRSCPSNSVLFISCGLMSNWLEKNKNEKITITIKLN